MSYFYASLAILAGAILAVYGVNTACDPYWSPGTRMTGIIGAFIGIGVLTLGLWSLSW